MVRVDSGLSLALHVAGVLRPGADRETNRAPDCPALETLLDRADGSPCSSDLTQHLCARFGLQRTDDDLPFAALTRAARFDDATEGVLALLSAVHLFIDRDRAYVVPLSPDSVSQDESDELQQLFSQQLATCCDDIRQETTVLWSLKIRAADMLRTVDIEAAAGEDARACLPQGPGASQWMALANELQMLLHAHPMNAQREQNGQPAINSVWLWGVGPKPQLHHRPFAFVYSDRTFVRGLAVLSDVPTAESPTKFTLPEIDTNEQSVCIALFDGLRQGEPHDWPRGVEELERDWFAPVHDALKNGSLQQATLWLGNGCEYRIDARQAARRRWRRPRVLRSHMQ